MTLVAPEDDACVDCGTPVTLRWSWPHGLEADECYRLRLWGAEQTPDLFSLTTTDDQFDLSTSDYPPGAYNWAVAVVNSITHEPVSKESKSLHFHIAPPPPVVRSISPAVTEKGISVTVVVSGENFTLPLTLTIGVPLSVTVVNSNTITTTIPTTLGVGKYPVVAQDFRGEGDSSAFFTVKGPPPPTVTPTLPSCHYPPPTLTGNGIVERNVTFRWDWSGVLAEDEWFAVRVGYLPDIPHSQYWAKEREYTYALCTLGGEPGDYIWEVAICRGEPTRAVCNLCAVSERQVFSFGGWRCD